MCWICWWDDKNELRQWLISYSSGSTRTLQTASTWPYAAADAKHLVVKVTHSVPGPFQWNNNMPHIYLCECNSKIFMARTYSSHQWLWPAYVKSRFAFARAVEIRGLCLQLKRSGTEHAVQKIIFWTSTVANAHSLPLWKVSTCPAHDITNFIDFDWFWQLFWFDLKPLRPQETVNSDLPDVCCSFKFSKKKHFISTLNV